MSLPDLDDLMPTLEALTPGPSLHHPSHSQTVNHSHTRPLSSKSPRTQTQSSHQQIVNSQSLPGLERQLLSPPAGTGAPVRPPSGSLARYHKQKQQQQPSDSIHHEGGVVNGGRAVNIVDMMAVDGEVLHHAGLVTQPLSRPTTATKRTNAHHHTGEDTDGNEGDRGYASGFPALPLENAVADFDATTGSKHRIRSGSKLNRAPTHQVSIDLIEQKPHHHPHGHSNEETLKVTTRIVVEETVSELAEDNDNQTTTSNGTMLPSLVFNSDARKQAARSRLLQIVDDIAHDYESSVEAQKQARITQVRHKVLQRAAEQHSAIVTIGADSSTPHDTPIHHKTSSVDMNATTTSAAAALTAINTTNNNSMIPQTTTSFSANPAFLLSNLNNPNGDDIHSRPYLDLSHSVTPQGKLVLELRDSLVAECVVTYLALRHTPLQLIGLKSVLQTYCRPWQLQSIKVLDLSDNPRAGGLQAARVLGQTLSQSCHLMDLNLDHLGMGDTGLLNVLQGLINGGAQHTLVKLDLSRNNITMATNAVALLGHFIHIK